MSRHTSKEKQEAVAELTRRLADLGGGGVLGTGGGIGGGGGGLKVASGWGGADAAMVRGVVHEWFADPGDEEPEGSAWVAPVTVLLHAAWAACREGGEGAEGAGSVGEHLVVWVGRRVWPGVSALALAGGEGAGVLRRSVFVDAVGVGARVWAMDAAARCAAVAAVVGDGSGLDMACSRRLQLAAATGAQGSKRGAMVMLARPWRERRVLSAASARWEVRSVESRAWGVGRPPRPRWEVRLVRGKGACGRGLAMDRSGWAGVLECDRAAVRLVVSAELERGPVAEAVASRRA